MSEHTPGPWTVLDGFTDTIVPEAHRQRPNGGADCENVDRDRYALVIARAEHNDLSRFEHEISRSQASANARLIAAAPEILEALKNLATEISGVWGYGEFGIRRVIGNTNFQVVIDRLEIAAAAIAKATGESL